MLRDGFVNRIHNRGLNVSIWARVGGSTDKKEVFERVRTQQCSGGAGGLHIIMTRGLQRLIRD